MNELRIHTAINSRYQIFDASGQLPFSIVFGFCRHSPADTDPRPVLFETAGSVLDVPYALVHGLLTIHERNPKDASQWIGVDLDRLKDVPAKEGEYLSLPSPVNRTAHWREAFTVHLYRIDVKWELASILETGKTYSVRLGSNDLGIKRWAYSDREQLTNDDKASSHDFEAVKLVNSKSTASNATFTVVESLPWPPTIETRMRLRTFSSSASDADTTTGKPSDGTVLEVTITNLGSDSVTVQTRGHQRFLVPWGPFQPEDSGYDNGLRLIDARSDRPRTSSLEIINSETGEVVERNINRHSAPLTNPNADQRPKFENVLILKSGEPVIREVDIGAILKPLKDGRYKIRMQPTGCRWWKGEIREEQCEDGRIPTHMGQAMIPPLMLESRDEVGICMRNGHCGPSE